MDALARIHLTRRWSEWLAVSAPHFPCNSTLTQRRTVPPGVAHLVLVRHMRTAILTLFLTALTALGREPTQEEYDIWAATLASIADQDVYVWHSVEPVSVFARGEEKGALERHPEFRPSAGAWSADAAEIDLERLKAASKANNGLAVQAGLKLLDQETLEKIVGRKPKPAWIVSPRLVEGTKAIVRLSWPAIREDGRAAYIICGEFTMWKGSICNNIIYKKANGRWWPGQKSMRDLLLWGPGWPEERDHRLFVDE